MTDIKPDSIRVVVVRAEGSTPREVGAAMQVSATTSAGTVGGGALELEAIAHARRLLRDGSPIWHRETLNVPLGPSLGQCCGGHVVLLFEVAGAADAAPECGDGLWLRPFTAGMPPLYLDNRHTALDRGATPTPLAVIKLASAMLSGARRCEPVVVQPTRGQAGWLIEPAAPDQHALFLYGAGHVGRAIVRALAGLPFAIHWVDTGADRFPDLLPAGVERIISTDLAAIAAAAPADAVHLVMTYSHPLDLAICHALLARGDSAWTGLIGSATKRARFSKRLLDAGIAAEQIARLHCPIGIGGITGKSPPLIAIAVAAELAIWSERVRATRPVERAAGE